MALVAYVALAVLVWTTISDQRLRFATLAVLALFAVKTWVRRKDVMHPDKREFTTETPSHGESESV
jgi:hypothetical protein